jgi:pyruvate, orthophosphate dikinase
MKNQCELGKFKRDISSLKELNTFISSLYPKLIIFSVDASFPVREVVSEGIVLSSGICSNRIPEDKGIYMSKNLSPTILSKINNISAIITISEDSSSHLAIVSRSKGIPIINLSDDTFDALSKYLLSLSVNKSLNFGIDTFNKKIIIGNITIDSSHVLENQKSALAFLRQYGLDIYANADTPIDIKAAVAKGYIKSWPRSETLLYEGNNLKYFNSFLLNPESFSIKSKFIDSHKKSIIDVYKAAQDTKIVFRLLDPPSHEFIPDLNDRSSIEELSEILGINTNETITLLRKNIEYNPMIGHRGARLLLTNKPLLEAQVLSIFSAWKEIKKEHESLEILIPFISTPNEFLEIKNRIFDILKSHDKFKNISLEIGCMIEIPSIMMYPDDIGMNSDFVSFGTNDLVAITYAISRGDSYQRYLSQYIKDGLIECDPFFVIPEKLLSQITLFCARLKKVNPKIRIDLCGEQALNTNLSYLIEKRLLDSISIGTENLPILVSSILRQFVRR